MFSTWALWRLWCAGDRCVRVIHEWQGGHSEAYLLMFCQCLWSDAVSPVSWIWPSVGFYSGSASETLKAADDAEVEIGLTPFLHEAEQIIKKLFALFIVVQFVQLKNKELVINTYSAFNLINLRLSFCRIPETLKLNKKNPLYLLKSFSKECFF